MAQDVSNTTTTLAETRRTEIVDAARELYEMKGLDRTTIKDITEAVGVTRSLFYHYFKDKNAVTKAVLDDYVSDLLEMVRIWDSERTPGDVRGALHDCVRILRIGVFDNDSFRSNLVTSENAGLYLAFLQRAAEALARFLTDVTAKEYEEAHGVKIKHVYDTFYLLIIGVVGYVRRYPDASDELLEDLIAQTLRMDTEVGWDSYLANRSKDDSSDAAVMPDAI